MSNEYFNPDNHFAQQAKLNEETARFDEIAARRELEAQKFCNQSNLNLIVQLRNNASAENESLHQLRQQNEQLAARNKFLEELLSLPMQDIAEKNAAFRVTHEAQQLALAKWILSQKVYAETALQLGAQAGKSTDEVQKIYKDNVSLVLANASKHGNNAVSHPVLKKYANRIINRN